MPDDRFPSYDPDVGAPYPDGWRVVEGAGYRDDLHLFRALTRIGEESRETQYVVACEYAVTVTVDGAERTITVPSGMLTDLTSSPRVARFFVGRVGPHLEAALVHDFLFVAWQEIPGRGPRREDFRFANDVMNALMEKAGVPGWKRALIGIAVSSFVGWRIFAEPNPAPRFVRLDAATPCGKTVDRVAAPETA